MSPLAVQLFAGAAFAALAFFPAGAASAAPTARVDFVALGDSYAAGLGAGTATGACRTSGGAYAHLWSASDAVALDFAACSGATSADVLAKQLGELDDRTDLVSLTVGGNDLGLIGAMRVCTAAPEGAECTAALAKIPQTLATTLPADLAKLLGAVRTAAPKAKIAVTGYPVPFADTASCPQVPLSATLRTAGNGAIAGLNKLLAAQAAAAGATYVDVTGTFDGHALCTTNPWLVGVEGIGDSTVLHPTLAGQKGGYLAAFREKVGTVEDIQSWIAERDAVATPPSPSLPASPAAPSSPAASPSDGVAAPVGEDGNGSGGGLPVTGPSIGIMVGIGVLLVAAGAGAYRFLRPKTIRTTVE